MGSSALIFVYDSGSRAGDKCCIIQATRANISYFFISHQYWGISRRRHHFSAQFADCNLSFSTFTRSSIQALRINLNKWCIMNFLCCSAIISCSPTSTHHQKSSFEADFLLNNVGAARTRLLEASRRAHVLPVILVVEFLCIDKHFCHHPSISRETEDFCLLVVHSIDTVLGSTISILVEILLKNSFCCRKKTSFVLVQVWN